MLSRLFHRRSRAPRPLIPLDPKEQRVLDQLRERREARR